MSMCLLCSHLGLCGPRPCLLEGTGWEGVRRREELSSTLDVMHGGVNAQWTGGTGQGLSLGRGTWSPAQMIWG